MDFAFEQIYWKNNYLKSKTKDRKVVRDITKGSLFLDYNIMLAIFWNHHSKILYNEKTLQN